MSPDPRSYRKWILANGWSEAVGLGTTFAIASVAAPVFRDATGVVPILAGALSAILLGTLLEGVLVGVAQERILRERFVRLPQGAWIAATAAGAGLGWLLGMVPSTLIALTTSVSAEPPTELSAFAQYGLAAALGAVAGPILGAAQWIVLRRYAFGAARWLWANALAWAVGMPLIFIGMDLVPWTGPEAVVLLAVYAVCGATGLVVGAIHGRVLLQLHVRTQQGSLQPRRAA